MADKFVQLKDSDGNNLYPVVADFPLSVDHGGTGATTAANALKNLVVSATEYNDALTGNLTGDTTRTHSYTASGGGLVFVSASTMSNGGTWGMHRTTIEKNNQMIAIGTDLFDYNSASGQYAANASALLKVVSGDVIKVTCRSNRYQSGNTYAMYFNVVALGCTLTVS
jgi:hypothetical protein